MRGKGRLKRDAKRNARRCAVTYSAALGGARSRLTGDDTRTTQTADELTDRHTHTHTHTTDTHTTHWSRRHARGVRAGAEPERDPQRTVPGGERQANGGDTPPTASVNSRPPRAESNMAATATAPIATSHVSVRRSGSVARTLPHRRHGNTFSATFDCQVHWSELVVRVGGTSGGSFSAPLDSRCGSRKRIEPAPVSLRPT